jgi:DNA-binding Lrp family transcriptional regulator
LTAYVLVQTSTRSEPIAPLLRTISAVVSASDLKGPYDAIAHIRARSRSHLHEIVLPEIRNLPGVDRVISALATEPLGEAA